MASGSKKSSERPYQSDRFIPNRLHFNVANAQHFMQSKSDTLSRLSFKNLETQNEFISYVGGPTSYSSALGKLLSTGSPTHLLPLSESRPISSATFTPTQLYKTPFFRSIGRNPISDTPELVLDAPGMMDDYYLNLLDWSEENILAVGLADCVYLWNAETHSITQLMQTSETALQGGTNLDARVYISSVHFLKEKGFILAVGLSNGFVQLWDIFSRKLIFQVDEAYYYGMDYIENTLSTGLDDAQLPSNRVSSLSSMSAHLLSAGSRFGHVRNYDLRLPFSSSLTSVYQGHSQEVCGLEWNLNGASLASGGNDNMVFIWDARSSGTYLQRLAKHTAAVKAIGWCPWKSNVLATGGGSTDRQLCIWNAMDGQCIENIDTQSQVCCLKWSTLSSELVTAHGYARNELTVWAYPQLTPVATIQAHLHRVLHLALSPDGTTVVSTASDENLKFWKLFEYENKKSTNKKEKEILEALPPSPPESEL